MNFFFIRKKKPTLFISESAILSISLLFLSLKKNCHHKHNQIREIFFLFQIIQKEEHTHTQTLYIKLDNFQFFFKSNDTFFRCWIVFFPFLSVLIYFSFIIYHTHTHNLSYVKMITWWVFYSDPGTLIRHSIATLCILAVVSVKCDAEWHFDICFLFSFIFSVWLFQFLVFLND